MRDTPHTEYFCEKKAKNVWIKVNDGLPICSEENCLELRCVFSKVSGISAISRYQEDEVNRKFRIIIRISIAVVLIAVFIVGAFIFASRPNQQPRDKLVELLQSDNEQEQLTAGIVLAERNDPIARLPLENILRSDSWENRRDSAEALGKLGDKLATPVLIETLYDSVPDVVAAAAFALAELDDPAAIDALVLAINDETRADRWAISSAFIKIQDERSIPGLASYVLQKGKASINPEKISADTIQENVAKAVANQGDKAIQVLTDSVLNGNNEALYTLAQIEKFCHIKIVPFHDAITNRDLELVARIYWFFLELDDDDVFDEIDTRLNSSELDVLASALLAYGDKNMATVFLNFHHSEQLPWNSNILQSAAAEWAEKNGYEVGIK